MGDFCGRALDWVDDVGGVGAEEGGRRNKKGAKFKVNHMSRNVPFTTLPYMFPLFSYPQMRTNLEQVSIRALLFSRERYVLI